MTLLDAASFLAPKIEHHRSIGSTNDEAMRRAREGHGGGLWVSADEQTGGRGRNGRVWSSPPGNLYASLLLINPAPVPRLPELGFVAGVALACALREALGGDRRLQIKWPNDMLFEGAKLAGLMLEGTQLPDSRFACVIGMGVNCATYPENLAYPATSLSEIAGRNVPAPEILARLASAMNHWLGLYAQGRNFAAIRRQWLEMAAGLDRPIEISQGDSHISGIFSTIDALGRLIILTSDGPQTIAAGDVFLGLPQAKVTAKQT